MNAPMEAITRHLEAIEETQASHSVALRGISDLLERIIEILTPPETSGPTLDEILAQLVAVVTDQNAILRRVDLRTADMADHMGFGTSGPLPPPPASSGQPGNGYAGNGAGHHGDHHPR